MIRAFERMTQSVLALLGEDALFNSVTRTRINIEYGVLFEGMDGNATQNRGDLTVEKDVATIANSVNPKVPQTFQFIDKTTDLPAGPVWRLDKFVDQNGYSKRFILLKV